MIIIEKNKKNCLASKVETFIPNTHYYRFSHFYLTWLHHDNIYSNNIIIIINSSSTVKEIIITVDTSWFIIIDKPQHTPINNQLKTTKFEDSNTSRSGDEFCLFVCLGYMAYQPL